VYNETVTRQHNLAFLGITDPTLLAFYANVPAKVHEGQVWRLLLCLFLSGGAFDCLISAGMVLVLGCRLEKMLGAWRIALVMLLAGLASQLTLDAVYLTKAGIFYGSTFIRFGLIGGMIGVLANRWHQLEGLGERRGQIACMLVVVVCLLFFSVMGSPLFIGYLMAFLVGFSTTCMVDSFETYRMALKRAIMAILILSIFVAFSLALFLQ
jgi:membrane associated rhomboid family serine protease